MIPKINHIRYAKLDSLLDSVNKLTRESRVNFFINLEPIFRKMLTKKFNQYLQVKKDERVIEMVSDIINMAAHYRAFFTNNGLYCKVYLYFGDIELTNYKNNDFNPEYRKYFRERFMRTDARPLYRVLQDTLTITKSITSYIEGVYLLTPKNIEPSLIPLVIKHDFSTDEVNILLTNDPYEYQYVNDDFLLLRANLDNSQILTSENIIERLKFENKIMSEDTIDPAYLPFILSFIGDKFRSIKGIRGMGVGKALKLFNDAIKENYLSEDGTTITIISEILKEEWREVVENNYAVIDLHTQLTRANVVQTTFIEKQLIDKFDNMSLKLLNQKFFDEHPLMLMELQNKDTDKRKKKNVFL